MAGLPTAKGEIVVEELIDDALWTNETLHGCIDIADSEGDTDRQMMIGFVHYVFARALGLSKCGKIDADHILGSILNELMRTAPGLDLAMMKKLLPSIHTLLSAGDPATMHIRVSTAHFIEAMKKGGCEIAEDGRTLGLLALGVESLQVEVSMFLNTVLARYLLDWTKDSGLWTEEDYRQEAEITGLRTMCREEAFRINGAYR